MNKILIYCLLAPLDFIGTIIIIIFFNPWAALFCDPSGYLPRWLKWVGTFDNSCDAIYEKYPTTGSKWLDRTRWLYRNPAYGWSYYVLGCPYNPWTWTCHEYTADRIYMTSTEGYFYLYENLGWIQVKIGWKGENVFDRENMLFENSAWGPYFILPITTSVNVKNSPLWKWLFG